MSVIFHVKHQDQATLKTVWTQQMSDLEVTHITYDTKNYFCCLIVYFKLRQRN